MKYDEMISAAIEKAPSQAAYTEAREKLTALRGRLDEANAKRSKLAAELDRSGKAAIAQAADDLLEGKPLDHAVSKTRETLDSLDRESRILEAAIGEQERRVRKLDSQRSIEACEQLRAAYQKIVAKMAETLKDFSVAVAAEEQFRDRIDLAGIQFCLYPAPFGIDAIRLDRGHSQAINWMADAKENGYVK